MDHSLRKKAGAGIFLRPISDSGAEVLLRPISDSDAEVLLRWAPDRLEGYSLPCEEEGLRCMIRDWNAGLIQNKIFAMYLIIADGNAAGLLSLFEEGEAMSVGVSVAAELRRRGYAEAAVCAAKDCVKRMGFVALTAQNCAENTASIALCKKCGFVNIGRGVNRKGNKVFYWRAEI